MMKKIVKYIFTFIIMIILFCFTLTLTSMIPQKCIKDKVIETSNILNEQTNRLRIVIEHKKMNMMFDNFTDALMINTAYSIDTKHPFYSAMVDRKNYIPEITEKIYPDTTGELKSASKYQQLDQVGELKDTVNNDITESFEYARYWHGYLIVLRPLLLILNITQIRILLTVLFIALALVVLYQLCKKVNVETTIIFLLCLDICDYFYMGMSLQGAPVFLITMITSIILLTKKIKDYNLIFLIVGGLTSFFDFLTVPIITLGVPIIIYLLMNLKENFKETYINIFKMCIFWGIGYLGVWVTKWILVDVIYHKGLINSVLEQVNYRTFNNTQNMNYSLKDILLEVMRIIKIPFSITFLLTIILTVINVIIKKPSKVIFNIKGSITYLLVGLSGVLWYSVLKNHSYLHAFFTYRNSFLISLALFLAILNLFKVKCNQQKEEEIK